jgi:hypothetical protein
MPDSHEAASDPAREADGGPAPPGLVDQAPGCRFTHSVAGNLDGEGTIGLVHG